jgi:hypothetical protein
LQFDGLDGRSRAFLLTAEFGYITSPVWLDFSGVVVNLTKAFECEFRRAIYPFLDKLQEVVITDLSFRGELSTFTLGAYHTFFRKHKPIVEPLFHQNGLIYEDVCNAIRKVNEGKGAKHLAKTSKADATRFRAIFFGRPSVLADLFSGK